MRRLDPPISAVLLSALRNPHSFQYHDFQSALKSVSTLIDFSHIAQYRSHILDTLSYLASSLQTFHQTKEIFLESRTSKATSTQADRQNQELKELIADHHPTEVQHSTIANRC